MTITIRKATNKDAKNLHPFAKMTYIRAFGHTMSEAEIEAILQTKLSTDRVTDYIKNDIILLAEMPTLLVGYVHISDIKMNVTTPTATSKELRRLYVHPDYQRLGIGCELMESALNTDMFKSADYVYLDVWEKNIGAIKLYQRYEFKKVGQLQFVHDSGELGDFDWIMCRHQSAE